MVLPVDAIGDRVSQTTSTTGTGTVALDAAVPVGRVSFVGAGLSGKSTFYTIESYQTGEWEDGKGTVTAGANGALDTISRDVVYSSSNGGSLVSFSAGQKTVFCASPARYSTCLGNTTTGSGDTIALASHPTLNQPVISSIVAASDGPASVAIYDSAGTTIIVGVNTSTGCMSVGTTKGLPSIQIGAISYILGGSTFCQSTNVAIDQAGAWRHTNAAAGSMLQLGEGFMYVYTVAAGASGATATLTITFAVSAAGSTILGPQSAVATSATDGFAYLPTCAGTPTGTPTSYTGKAAAVVDTTNNYLYVRVGSTWKKATLS